MVDDKPKKRPRDILSSLDAAFAATETKAPSKYTSQAALQVNAAATQQAYQHSKHKKKKQNEKQKAATAAATAGQNAPGSTANKAKGNSQQRPGSAHPSSEAVKQAYDPLYGRLDIATLQVGLKNCSLHATTASLRKAVTLNATLKQYIGNLTSDGNASAMTEKLKNKVLQFDNPIRTADATKRTSSHAQAQSAKLLSARQRRKAGMHMMATGMQYSEAEQLCEIWKRYARDLIGNDFAGDNSDEAVRSGRLQAKLRNIDLSGCPIEVIKSRNPCHVGILGIIVADKTQIIQVCASTGGKVITLPKQELRIRVTLNEQRSFFIDGGWLLMRRSGGDWL